jgi:hypothetical protein
MPQSHINDHRSWTGTFHDPEKLLADDMDSDDGSWAPQAELN